MTLLHLVADDPRVPAGVGAGLLAAWLLSRAAHGSVPGWIPPLAYTVMVAAKLVWGVWAKAPRGR